MFSVSLPTLGLFSRRVTSQRSCRAGVLIIAYVLLFSTCLWNPTRESPVTAVAADEDSFVIPKVPRRPRTKQAAVIVVYALPSCEEGHSLHGVIQSDVPGGVSYRNTCVERAMWKQLRNNAFSTLEERIAHIVNQTVSGFETRVPLNYRLLLDPSVLQHYEPIREYRDSCPKLNTVYLPSLHMEIIEPPTPLTEDHLVVLAQAIPSVISVQKDTLILSTNSNLRSSLQQEQSTDTAGSVERLRLYREFLSNKSKRNASMLDDLHYIMKKAPENNDFHFNDPLISLQWYLHRQFPYGVHVDPAVNAIEVSRKVIVAILDNGCDVHHPDLVDNLWRNENEICGDGIDNDRNGYVDDCFGWDWVDNDNDPRSAKGNNHGAGGAGIIGATPNNGIGIIGLCSNCQLMCLRFIDGVDGNVSHQIMALDYAIRMGARISSNGYGSYGYSNLEYYAIRRAELNGHLFVTSAGNTGINTDNIQIKHTPSGYNLNNIISVGASTVRGNKATYSNFGTETVHVFAPGDLLLTTSANSSYEPVSGTSFSAPVVAGIAGVVLSLFPDMHYSDIKLAIIQSCNPVDALANMSRCGGIVSVSNAIYHSKEIYMRNVIEKFIVQHYATPRTRSSLRAYIETAIQNFGLCLEPFLSLNPLLHVFGMCLESTPLNRFIHETLQERKVTLPFHVLTQLNQKLLAAVDKRIRDKALLTPLQQ